MVFVVWEVYFGMLPIFLIGVMLMDDKEFTLLAEKLQKYLKREKVFVKNPARFAEVEHAFNIAQKLFSNSEVTIDDDPIQMGALILRIEGYDIVAVGQEEIALFSELISKADNFEIYAVGDEKIKFSLVFSGALTRLP